MRLVRAFGVLFALAALPCAADETRVVSTAPDEVSVTIYRDLFALVTETRTVDLPEGPVTLVFDGVVETLLPQSAVVADTGRTVAEGNYDFERLSPANLLRKSIGRTVTLTRTNRATGKASQLAATVVSANDNGVVFRTAAGNEALYCSGLPEQLTFDEIPAGITASPTLSIRLAAGTAGKRRVRVSYLAHGFAWSADYLGHVAPGGKNMDLLGWLTLRNFTGATFRDAQVQVVAGKLNLLDKEDGGTSLVGATADYYSDDSLLASLREAQQEMTDQLEDEESDADADVLYGCYPQGPARFAAPAEALQRREAAGYVDSITAEDIGELEEVVVTGARQSLAVRENLADYQMYRLPAHTDLNAHQTKQVAFIHKPDVKIDRFYGIRIADNEDYDSEELPEEDWLSPDVQIAWLNRESEGLGEPLPGGRMRIFDAGDDGAIFAGDADIHDSPVGTPVQIRIAGARDLAIMATLPVDDEPQARWTSLLTRRVYLPLEFRMVNDKPVPVVVEIRQGPMYEYPDLRVGKASARTTRKAGDYAWRITVPAQGEARLSYEVSGRVPDEGD